MDAGVVVPVAGMMFVLSIILGIPYVRAITKKMESETRRPPALPPELMSRMEHMEQAIDAIALEVERIAEGQRFTTKLLADRSRDGAREGALPPAQGQPPRA